MSMLSVNVATPVIYGTAAVVYTQMNSVAAHAGTMPFQLTVTPPGRSLSECVDFVFSPDFRKFIKASNEVPPVTVVGEIGDYLSACICKVYNATIACSANLSNIVKDTISTPPKPPENSNVYSIDEIPPIFRNVSNYFFKVFIPYAEKQKREPGVIGLGESNTIYFKLEFAKTIINLDTTHYYADGSTPAMNVLSASVFCRKDWYDNEDMSADNILVDLVKRLSITYFKQMGAEVYVNDSPL